MTKLVVIAAATALSLSLVGCGNAGSCAATCVGCCDASGTCQPPTNDHCGASGAACQACIGGNSCVSGACQVATTGGGNGGGSATTTGGSTGTTTTSSGSSGSSASSGSTGTTSSVTSSGSSGGSTGSTGCNGGPACQATEVCTSNGCLQSCSAPDSQDICAVGQACFAISNGNGDVCEDVGNPAPALGQSTCSIAQPTAWTPSDSPTIWGVHQTGQRDTSNDASNACSTNTTDVFGGLWYDPTNTTPIGSTGATYTNILVMRSQGGSAMDTYYHTAINADGSFSFELCTDSSPNIVAVALRSGSNKFSNAACIR